MPVEMVLDLTINLFVKYAIDYSEDKHSAWYLVHMLNNKIYWYY